MRVSSPEMGPTAIGPMCGPPSSVSGTSSAAATRPSTRSKITAASGIVGRSLTKSTGGTIGRDKKADPRVIKLVKKVGGLLWLPAGLGRIVAMDLGGSRREETAAADGLFPFPPALVAPPTLRTP